MYDGNFGLALICYKRRNLVDPNQNRKLFSSHPFIHDSGNLSQLVARPRETMKNPRPTLF